MLRIFVTAQIAVIGALIKSCKPIAISISTCVTSLVVLVIKLLVEKPLTSSVSMFSTLSKISFLKFLEKLEEIVAAKYPAITAKAKLPKAHKTI